MPVPSSHPTLESAPPISDAAAPGEPSLPRARILLADGDAQRRDQVRRLLGDGYVTTSAGDGRQALEIALFAVPDLVICDITMPVLDGFGLLSALRADRRTAEVPLVFLSAQASPISPLVPPSVSPLVPPSVSPLVPPSVSPLVSPVVSPVVSPDEALERGAQGVLVLPLEARELRERVESCLRLGWLRREESRQRVEEILESITDAFYALDRDWRFTYINNQTESFFNKRREELLGQVIWDVFPGVVGTVFDQNYHAVMLENRAIHFEAVSPVFHRWIEVNVYPSPRGLSIYFRDISGRRRDEEERERLLHEAQEASRVKDEFLAIVSHELRTPLNAILGWSNLLASGDLEPDDAQRGLAAIERNAKAQAQIIEDILDVSRIANGKMRLETRPMPLQSVLEAALDTTKPAASAKGIELIFDIQEPLGLVAGDASRLQQVFWNLLSNAVKFTPPQGRIWIGARLRKTEVEVAVSDTGTGIAPEFLPFVFDRFRQADMSSTREFGGLGLGLSIVRQLVELHGGSVEVQSEGRGQGTTFFVTLPRLKQLRAPRLPLVSNDGADDDPAGRDSNQKDSGHQSHEVWDSWSGAKDGVLTPVQADTQFDAPADAQADAQADADFDGVTAAGQKASSNWRSAHTPALQGLRVLVVDDELDAREVVAMVLQRGGATVQAAASSTEALQALELFDFDLLISDIGMPGGDGYELIRKLRRAAREADLTPVLAVALTAYTRIEDRQRALDAGYQDHIAKPIDPESFLEAIAAVVEAG